MFPAAGTPIWMSWNTSSRAKPRPVSGTSGANMTGPMTRATPERYFSRPRLALVSPWDQGGDNNEQDSGRANHCQGFRLCIRRLCDVGEIVLASGGRDHRTEPGGDAPFRWR